MKLWTKDEGEDLRSVWVGEHLIGTMQLNYLPDGVPIWTCVTGGEVVRVAYTREDLIKSIEYALKRPGVIPNKPTIQ